MSATSWIVVAVATAAVSVLAALLLLNHRGRRTLAATTERLAASEARLRGLAETVPAGIFQTDAQGRRVYVNPRLAEITGDASPDEVVARPWLIHDDDEQRVLADWAKAAAALSSYRARFRIRRTDGEVRWVAVEARPLATGGDLTGWVGSVVDVTEEEAATADLRRFQEILAATPDLVAMVDTSGRLTYVNTAARERLRLSPDDLADLQAVDLYTPGSRAMFLGQALPTAERLGVWSGEVELTIRDGGVVPVSQVVIAHRRPDGSIDYYSSIMRDLSERRAFEEQLEQAGMYDALTGLPNRGMLVAALAGVLEAGQPVAALLLDVDHFKLVNDSFGHDSGDLLLRLVAQRIQDAAGAGRLLARFGGDVFCLLLDGVADEAEAMDTAGLVGAAMGVPFRLGADEVFLSVSTGVALSVPGEAPVTADTLLRDADAALHRAKERGRARVELFVEDYRATAVHRLRTANDLHRAITEAEFSVVYQPEIDIRTGHVSAVEALVRWHHPERGQVPPQEFIPLAEQTGLIAPIGAWMLDTALSQASEWSTARHDGAALPVWVNLSARQLADPKMVDAVATALKRHGVDPSQLGLEITESALLEDAEAAVAALGALREIGVRLAVDDFGTGYSSLSYVKRLPVDAVKVDRSFIDGLPSDGDDSAIVAAVAGMARALRLTTIAEGVENLDQLRMLRRLGCDLAQGYFFTTPQPASHISRLLESDRRAPLFRYDDTADELPVQRTV